MSKALNVQTQFKIYQIAKMEQEINTPKTKVDITNLQKFVTDNITLMQSLDLHTDNSTVNKANQNIRNSISSQVTSVENKINELKAEEGVDNKFYRDAITATTESLLNNRIYPKTKLIHLSVTKSVLLDNADVFAVNNGDLKEQFTEVLSKVANNNGLSSDVFMCSDEQNNPHVYVVNLSFPGCGMVNQVVFNAIKEIDNEFAGLVSVYNGLGNDLVKLASTHGTYQRALSAEGKTHSEGLFTDRYADLADEYEDVVIDHESFGKVYDKWEKTSVDNKESFDFGIVK
jgi:hypothetical protein